MNLAIDPGNDTGWALWDRSDRLIDCGVSSPDIRGVFRVVIECPQVYTARLMKGDPNDLIKVAVWVGMYKERYISRGASIKLVTPSQWKGQVDKRITEMRAREGLTKEELALATLRECDIVPSKRNNMWDAIGIGRWAYQRASWS